MMKFSSSVLISIMSCLTGGAVQVKVGLAAGGYDLRFLPTKHLQILARQQIADDLEQAHPVRQKWNSAPKPVVLSTVKVARVPLESRGGHNSGRSSSVSKSDGSSDASGKLAAAALDERAERIRTKFQDMLNYAGLTEPYRNYAGLTPHRRRAKYFKCPDFKVTLVCVQPLEMNVVGGPASIKTVRRLQEFLVDRLGKKFSDLPNFRCRRNNSVGVTFGNSNATDFFSDGALLSSTPAIWKKESAEKWNFL